MTKAIMHTKFRVNGFLNALYQDRQLKNWIILWTVMALVVPAALLVAAGLPETPVFLAMVALIVPLQFLVYRYRLRQKEQKPSVHVPWLTNPHWSLNWVVSRALSEARKQFPHPISAHVKTFKTTGPHRGTVSANWGDVFRHHRAWSDVTMIVTHPDTDSESWAEILYRQKWQNSSLLCVSHHGSIASHLDVKPGNLLLTFNADELLEGAVRMTEQELLRRVDQQRQSSDALLNRLTRPTPFGPSQGVNPGTLGTALLPVV
jgi:hypothetical protein